MACPPYSHIFGHDLCRSAFQLSGAILKAAREPRALCSRCADRHAASVIIRDSQKNRILEKAGFLYSVRNLIFHKLLRAKRSIPAENRTSSMNLAAAAEKAWFSFQTRTLLLEVVEAG